MHMKDQIRGDVCAESIAKALHRIAAALEEANRRESEKWERELDDPAQEDE